MATKEQPGEANVTSLCVLGDRDVVAVNSESCLRGDGVGELFGKCRCIEIRFCPDLHCEEGLTHDQVVESVVSGFQKGALEGTGIEVGGIGGVVGGIIVCALRTNPPEHGMCAHFRPLLPPHTIASRSRSLSSSAVHRGRDGRACQKIPR